MLNSLAGEAMEASITCLRPFGRFVELGKRDYVENTNIGLRPFRKNLSYFGVDLDQLMVEGRPDHLGRRRSSANFMKLFERRYLDTAALQHFQGREYRRSFSADAAVASCRKDRRSAAFRPAATRGRQRCKHHPGGQVRM